MGKIYKSLEPQHYDFIAKQKIYFLATASLRPDTRVNVSPKGYSTLVVRDNKAYHLDLGGSGSETIAHVLENGRITVMLCAFEGAPNILRLWCKARIATSTAHSEEFNKLLQEMYPAWIGQKGLRSIVVMDIYEVGTSCGFSVPFFNYVQERETLTNYWTKKTDEQALEYWNTTNAVSLDGLASIGSLGSGKPGWFWGVVGTGGAVNAKRLLSQVAYGAALIAVGVAVGVRLRGMSKKTVASLHPGQAITVIEGARVVQAAQLMASKKQDAVLVVNSDGQLSGIMSDRDIVNRVIAEGRDPRTTLVRDVMTRDPLAVYDSGLRNEALNIMLEKRFRHLPVISVTADEQEDDDDSDDEGAQTNIVGLIDITKLVFDKLDDLERKVLSGGSCPDLGSVLRARGPAPLVPSSASIREVALIMKENHATGVLLVEVSEFAGGDHALAGIATTKDLVARVVATGLDPNVTLVSSVMTPNPKSANPSTSILDALKALYVGHYLHLPVVDGNAPIGLVDVLTLTMSMLDYMIKKENPSTSFNNTETSGPLWNSFWNSTWTDTESNAGSEHLSDHGGNVRFSVDSHRTSGQTFYTATGNASARNSYMNTAVNGGNRQSIPAQLRSPTNGPLSSSNEVPPYGSNSSYSIAEQQRAMLAQQQQEQQRLYIQQQQLSSPGTSVYHEDEIRINIKLTDPSRGKVVRFSVMQETGLQALKTLVTSRLGASVATSESLRLSYEDDDGDYILLSNDADLEEAINLSLRLGEKLSLKVEEDANPDATSPALEAANDANGRGTPASKSVFGALNDVPLSVNVAISAGIVVAAAFVLSRLYNQHHF
ncbi:hypothetical protein HDU80_007688 [Chytriomyces hyalinus]|nr:hypothetical protein HDU80_007688 [Chytriomyces hyalinus]